MKTEEDEAFDDLARKQGMWGGGFQAKRQAAMDKINSHFDEAYKKMHEDRAMYSDIVSDGGLDPRNQFDAQPVHCQCPACKDGVLHASDCAVHTGPAYAAGPCDCGVAQDGKCKLCVDGCIACDARAQPAQEPFGYFKAEPFGWIDCAETDEGAKALYEAEPKREWVGLTDDEVYKIAFSLQGEHWRKIADAIEAKLNEKNS